MYAGILGKITIAGNDVAYISNWSVEDTADIIEVSKLGSKYKEKTVGQQSWSASADGAIEFADVNGKNSGQEALFTAKHNRKSVTCKFYLTAETGNEVYFEGEGFIESLSVDLSAEDKGNVSVSISGSGELKLHKPSPAQNG